ncbi:MAG: hypothetical protein H2057_02910 [Alphaproteobacteria bacterium]|nr:hypothetical protein [Alphaproteobacteria bacterium]
MAGINVASGDFGHHNLASCDDPSKESEYYWTILMEQQQHATHKVVLSSEGFLRPSDNLVAFSKEFDSVKILLYVRDQLSLIESIYLTHQVMGGTFSHLRHLTNCGYFSDIEDFFRKSSEIFDFFNYIGAWQSIFGKESMRARLYLPRSDSFDVLDDFLDCLDIDKTRIVKPLERLNISLMPDFSSLLLSLDEADLFKSAAPHIRRQVIENLLRLSDQFRHTSTNSLISPELAGEIKNLYRESNKAFAQEYLTPSEADILLS